MRSIVRDQPNRQTGLRRGAADRPSVLKHLSMFNFAYRVSLWPGIARNKQSAAAILMVMNCRGLSDFVRLSMFNRAITPIAVASAFTIQDVEDWELTK